MRIKHWQGYGCVSAKKLSLRTENGMTELKIRVEGDHEYGIESHDPYMIRRWLIERFDKSFERAPGNAPINISTVPGFADDGKTERCDYIIRYKSTA